VIDIKALKETPNLRQNENDGDDMYVRRISTSVDTLILSGGKHISASSEHALKAGDTMTDIEMKVEEEKFLRSAIPFLFEAIRLDPFQI